MAHVHHHKHNCILTGLLALQLDQAYTCLTLAAVILW